MNKFIILATCGAVLVLAQEQQRGPDGEFGDHDPSSMTIPGVSDENMQKLREQMKEKSASPEEGKLKMDSWRASLPEDEKTAAETFFSQREAGHHGRSTPSQ